MKINIFEESIIGYKNITKHSCSQDYLDYKRQKDYMVFAVSDGYSMKPFKYSHIGSKLACESVFEITDKYISNKNKDLFIFDLKNGQIQSEIKNTWEKLVFKDFYSKYPKAYKINYTLYATTISFVIILKDKIVFFNLGDGEIVIKQDEKYNLVFENNNDKLVNSLAMKNCTKKMQYKILKGDLDLDIALFTDGFKNSFSSREKLYKELDIVFDTMNKDVFRVLNLKRVYKKHLINLSKRYSFDDISIIFISFRKN